MISLPIKNGTRPSVDQQVNNPRLRNAFINKDEQIQLLPNLLREREINNCRAVLESNFNNRIIIVTDREVSYWENSSLNKVGEITSTTNPVRLKENTQNQVTIVNGSGAWVFEQRTNGFSQLSETNGFTLKNPVDVTVLDTITVIVGADDDEWIISQANNALIYLDNLIRVIDNSIGKLSGCASLNNNLFIFGDTGIERWVPSIERVSTDFPFTQDPTYKDDYGCISTASLIRGDNQLFYLTANNKIRMMSHEGTITISTDGIEEIINNYENIKNSFGSYFIHKGDYLYQLTFPDNENAFVYCPSSKKWSETDQLYLGISDKIILKDGLYSFTKDFNNEYKTIVIQSDYFIPNPNMYHRSIISSVLLKVTQGKGNTDKEQICYLQFSRDNVLYGNRGRHYFAEIGERQRVFSWFPIYSNNGFSVRFTLVVQEDVTILTASAILTKNTGE